MELSAPDIGSTHWLSHLELDLEDSFFTDPTDDLSRLVATSTSSIPLQEKASMYLGDVGLSSQFKGSSQKRGACEVDSSETMLGIYGRSSKHPNVNSCNISFGHPRSYEGLSLSLHTSNRLPSSLYAQYEQAHMIDSLSTCMGDELYPNVTTKPAMYSSDIEQLQVLGRVARGLADPHSSVRTALMKRQPHSSLSSIQGGEIFSLKTTVQDTSTLSKSTGVHIMAERKRREKLNQRFIALSAMVPGLKKVDKATVLGDAIKYVKRLEEQIEVLQDIKVPKPVNSVVVPDFSGGAHSPSNILDEKDKKVEGFQQPDIEARVVGKTVLIRVHCDKIKSVLVKALEELEKLQLSVVTANILSFSNTTLDLTFTGQIDEDSNLTASDIVNALHTFFKELN